MKKIVIGFTVLTLGAALALSGCGGTSSRTRRLRSTETVSSETPSMPDWLGSIPVPEVSSSVSAESEKNDEEREDSLSTGQEESKKQDVRVDINTNEDSSQAVKETTRPGGGAADSALTIVPIAENPVSINAIRDVEDTVPPLTIGSFSGSVSVEDQKNDHSFSPTVSGTYRFEFDEVKDGVDFYLWVCNSGGESIEYGYDLDEGDGVTVSLEAGSDYIIRVGQYRSFGSYSVIIGEQKPAFDVSDLTKVADSVQYTDQENNYLFTPTMDGTYRFELADVPDGTDFRLELLNMGWETIKYDYDLDNGDGLTAKLEEGKSYYVRVQQYRSLGSYSLIVGKQKEIMDVTPYTVLSDSVQFTEQRNAYRFKAEREGTYRFEFAGVPDGTDLRMEICNLGWENIKYDYDMDTGDGLTTFLSEGQEIYVVVDQYRSLGSYSLILGKPKQTIEISDVRQLNDSVQYTEQKNAYLFEAKTAGKYSFKFQEVEGAVSLRMELCNTAWETMKYDYGMETGDKLEIDLSEGQKIYVCVCQHRGTGNYGLVVTKE